MEVESGREEVLASWLRRDRIFKWRTVGLGILAGGVQPIDCRAYG